jgi:hypothetical protein
MRCRGFETTGLSAWRRRTSAAAWANGLSPLVSGTGANVNTGDIVMSRISLFVEYSRYFFRFIKEGIITFMQSRLLD